LVLSPLAVTALRINVPFDEQPTLEAMPETPATRLYVDAALASGATVALGAAEAHRLRAVLRLQPGDALALWNGRDGEWLARIAGLGRSEAKLSVIAQRRAQAEEGDLWLVFALVKRTRLELMLEKATELGASAFVPVVTEHTVVRDANLERLAAIIREAAEQSERLTLPQLQPARPLAALLGDWPAARRLVLCDETGAAPPAAQVLAQMPPGPLAVLIGPEGGFAETELDALRNLPFVFPVGLGPRVLRSETAALAALAVVQALAGDWVAPRRQKWAAASSD
jgi:16S rRNA (uracil1498-N3)-methyltransferase